MPNVSLIVPITFVRRSSRCVKTMLAAPTYHHPSSSRQPPTVPTEPKPPHDAAIPDAVLEVPPTSSFDVPPATNVPPPPVADEVLVIATLVNILHTISDHRQLYFQYAIARDQALRSALQRPYQNLDNIWPPSPNFPPYARPPKDDPPTSN